MARRTDSSAADRILDAAVQLWAEKGYAASTMRELGRRVGMGTSTLYGHFRSKEEIAQALYARLNAEAITRARAESQPGETLAAGLARFLHLKLRILAQHRAVLPTLLREAVDPDSAIHPLASDSATVRSAVVGHLEALLRGAADAPVGDPERNARLVWAAHLAVVLYFCHDRSPGSANSHALVDQLAGSLGLLTLLPAMPGAAEVLALVDAVLDPAPVAETESPTSDTADRRVDVLIVGAGPIGCVLAGFLKKRRPTSRILLVDKALEPGHKIGESTLSGFCKALRTLGVPHQAMQRLFHAKNGLGFFHVTEGVPDLQHAPEYILETFDETFQVERRPLELLLHRHLESLGVELVLGADAKLATADLGSDGSVVDVHIGPSVQRIATRFVVDATGPASSLAKRFGLWTSDGPPFQTSAVWGYWRDLPPMGEWSGWPTPSQFPRHEYTQHVCFREGWLWVIPLVSWQQAPTRNLDRLVGTALSDSSLPDRDALAARFGCPTRPLTSIGLVLRSDRDQQLDPHDAIEAYRRRYPAIDQLLRPGTLESDPYGLGAPFGQRRRMRGHARRVTGDGWLLVGNAAFFVDPLISPGLTAGTACAWQAAKALDAALSGSTDALDRYATFVHELHAAHERDNQLVYLSFNHPEAMALVQRMQEVDARRHFLVNKDADYDEIDTNVWGILDPAYQALQRDAWQILRDAELAADAAAPVHEQRPEDYAAAVAALRDRLGAHLDHNESLTPYVRQAAGGAR